MWVRVQPQKVKRSETESSHFKESWLIKLLVQAAYQFIADTADTTHKLTMVNTENNIICG